MILKHKKTERDLNMKLETETAVARRICNLMYAERKAKKISQQRLCDDLKITQGLFIQDRKRKVEAFCLCMAHFLPNLWSQPWNRNERRRIQEANGIFEKSSSLIARLFSTLLYIQKRPLMIFWSGGRFFIKSIENSLERVPFILEVALNGINEWIHWITGFYIEILHSLI